MEKRTKFIQKLQNWLERLKGAAIKAGWIQTESDKTLWYNPKKDFLLFIYRNISIYSNDFTETELLHINRLLDYTINPYEEQEEDKKFNEFYF